MRFRVRYSVWYVEASSPKAAKKAVVEMYKKSADKLIAVEEAETYDPKRRPLWRLFLGF